MIGALFLSVCLSTQTFFGLDDSGQMYEYESVVSDESLSSNQIQFQEDDGGETSDEELSVVPVSSDYTLYLEENQMVLQEILTGVRSISSSVSSGSVPSEDVSEPVALSVESYASSSLPDSGVVVITGTLGNDACTLIIPEQYYESLWVDSEGYLFNVAGGTISGRVFYDQTFDSTNYEYTTYTLGNIYGSSNNVYRYGGYNYKTDYTRDGAGIDSNQVYVNMHVDDIYVARAPSLEYKMYLVGLGVLLLIGGVVICSYRSSRHW